MEWLMKRLVLAVTVILVLVTLAAAGCAGQEPVSLAPGEEQGIVSSCVTCHTDKDILKEVATPEPEEAKSEATSGEG